MNMLRIGRIIVNLDHVIDILQGDPASPHSQSLILHLVNGQKHTFTGDDALGLAAYLDRTVRNATVPLKDFEV